MTRNMRPIQFFDLLPLVFRAGSRSGNNTLDMFMKSFEKLFEEFETAIEGVVKLYVSGKALQEVLPHNCINIEYFDSGVMDYPAGTTISIEKHTRIKEGTLDVNSILTSIEVEDEGFAKALKEGDMINLLIQGIPCLIVRSRSGSKVQIEPYDGIDCDIPKGTYVSAMLHTSLKEKMEFMQRAVEMIEVVDNEFIKVLKPGDALNLGMYKGGLPDLFNPDIVTPPQFTSSSNMSYLEYLAGWLALPLRKDKSFEWNRRFFQRAIGIYPLRGTLKGIDRLIREWLREDLLEDLPRVLIVTDLTSKTRAYTNSNKYLQINVTSTVGWDTQLTEGSPPLDTVFQIGETATLGFDTLIGEGPPHFFVVDLITDSSVRELRNPLGLDAFYRAACFLCDNEKPAHTYYQLRIRSHTMQLAPENSEEKREKEVYAVIGETTMLWDEPWIDDRF